EPDDVAEAVVVVVVEPREDREDQEEDHAAGDDVVRHPQLLGVEGERAAGPRGLCVGVGPRLRPAVAGRRAVGLLRLTVGLAVRLIGLLAVGRLTVGLARLLAVGGLTVGRLPRLLTVGRLPRPRLGLAGL